MSDWAILAALNETVPAFKRQRSIAVGHGRFPLLRDGVAALVPDEDELRAVVGERADRTINRAGPCKDRLVRMRPVRHGTTGLREEYEMTSRLRNPRVPTGAGARS